MKLCLGGANLGVFDECLMVDELAQGCTGICTVLISTNLGVSRCNKIVLGTIHFIQYWVLYFIQIKCDNVLEFMHITWLLL